MVGGVCMCVVVGGVCVWEVCEWWEEVCVCVNREGGVCVVGGGVCVCVWWEEVCVYAVGGGVCVVGGGVCVVRGVGVCVDREGVCVVGGGVCGGKRCVCVCG